MAYCSASNILVLLPKLTNTTTVTTVITAHITRSDAIINGMIAKRYGLPFSATPPLIIQISEDLTGYFTYRSFYAQDNQSRFDYFDELKANALNLLDMIRKGEVDLVDTSGSIIDERTTEGNTVLDSNTEDYQPYFDLDDCLDWKFDSEMLDDIDRG